jgi:hypothetical protein
MDVSRRQFARFAAAGVAAAQAARAQNGGLTARQVIEQIQKNIGVPPRADVLQSRRRNGKSGRRPGFRAQAGVHREEQPGDLALS